MRNLSGWRTPFLMLFLLFFTWTGRAQVRIGSGTNWVSSFTTTVVLDDMDLLYDGADLPLGNVFRFTGMGGNVIGGTTRPIMYAISLAKTDPGGLLLNQSIKVTKRIHFDTGILDLNGNGITLAPQALLTNEREASRIIGPLAGGYISIDADLSAAPLTINPGNLGAVITTATDLGIVNIARGHDYQHINDSTQSIARWFEISAPDNKPPDAGFRFNYFRQEVGELDPDSLVLWQGYDGIGWNNVGYTTRDAGQKYVEKQGLTKLHRFTLYPSIATGGSGPGGPSTPTPGAVLLYGNWTNNLAALSWTATSEVNTDHFVVERKYASETTFKPIRNVATIAPGGTSSTGTSYAYTDSTVKTSPDNVSYRVNELSTGGQSTYSNIVTLKAIVEEGFILKLFPTVVTGRRVYIQAGNMSLSTMQFEVFDGAGKRVMAGTLTYQSQWLQVSALSHGIYRVVITSGDQQFHSTFLR